MPVIFKGGRPALRSVYMKLQLRNRVLSEYSISSHETHTDHRLT